jgi:hypothetical protein
VFAQLSYCVLYSCHAPEDFTALSNCVCTNITTCILLRHTKTQECLRNGKVSLIQANRELKDPDFNSGTLANGAVNLGQTPFINGAISKVIKQMKTLKFQFILPN